MNTNAVVSTLCVVLSAILLVSCGGPKKEAARTLFGQLADGQKAYIYTLKNVSGMEAKITNYGGIVVSLLVPDKNGKLGDVVLGYDSLQGYVADKDFLGALIGRYGNRIGRGKFTLDGKEYTLATNNAPNHLHGGVVGFNKVLWTVNDAESQDGKSLTLTYVSKDGEEGYPGNLSVKVHYELTAKNELKVEYLATTDAPTVVNLTQHSYFNLAGTGDILGHLLTLDAGSFTPVDAGLIPTGEIRPVAGTPMDFRKATAIGARVQQDDEQLKFGQGYDHNWVLSDSSKGMRRAARVDEPGTGRIMEVWTTEPGIQFYCGNFLNGTIHGKGGVVYQRRTGFCLETQHYPDSPNKPMFPSTVLRPGERYATTTVYKFAVQ